jgi:hypothetical protein
LKPKREKKNEEKTTAKESKVVLLLLERNLNFFNHSFYGLKVIGDEVNFQLRKLGEFSLKWAYFSVFLIWRHFYNSLTHKLFLMA